MADDDYNKLRVPELKALLKARSLTVSGSKSELVERLVRAKQDDSVNEDEEDEDEEKPAQNGAKRKATPPSGINKKQKTETGSVDTVDFSKPALASDELKLVTWNVASLKSVMEKGFVEYIKQESPDILCLNETKVSEGIYEDKFSSYGYSHVHFAACSHNPGYSGTGLLSKVKPLSVTKGIGTADHDTEGRVITAEYEGFYVVATYIPNSGEKGDDKWPKDLAYRGEWDKAFLDYLLKLKEKKSVIWCGDLNVAHKEIDLANPKRNTKSAGFTSQEREAFQKVLDNGFADSYRTLHPEETDCFTFWSYRFNCRQKNIGWRLDYFVVSDDLLPRVTEAYPRRHVQGSDHCPLVIHLKKQ